MKVILDLPDETTSLGLFITVNIPPEKLTSVTNWLTKPKDCLVIEVSENGKLLNVKEK